LKKKTAGNKELGISSLGISSAAWPQLILFKPAAQTEDMGLTTQY
jgi:hypothetical protein